MTLTALAAAWVGGLLLGQHAALPVEALALWCVAGAALWSSRRRGAPAAEGSLQWGAPLPYC